MSTDQAVLEVRGLRKSYPGRSGGRVQALAGLDFALPPGRSLAIVGESGSGKTTAALCIAKLALADAGQVLLSGADILAAGSRETVALRRQFGVVLQNPLTALDPRVRIWRSVAEPLPPPPQPLPFDAAVTRPFASTMIFAAVYEPAVTPLAANVVAALPALVVMSPVNAGNCAAAKVPLVIFDAASEGISPATKLSRALGTVPLLNCDAFKFPEKLPLIDTSPFVTKKKLPFVPRI